MIDPNPSTDGLLLAAIEKLAAAINDANGAVAAARKLYGQAPAPRPYFRLGARSQEFSGAA
jgi:hypothetical protein